MNKLKTGVVLSYISIGITMLSSVLYTPIMLKNLGQNEFGIYQLASTIVGYLSILNLGFSTSYMRLYSKFKVKNQCDEIARLNGMFLVVFFVLSILILILGGGIICNIEILLNKTMSANDIVELKYMMIILLVNMAVTLPGAVLDCNIVAHEEFVFQKLLAIAGNIIIPCCTIPLLLWGFGNKGMVWVMFFVNVIKLFSSYHFCLIKTKMKFKFDRFQMEIFREISIFTFWVFINNIVDQINWGIDKFLLGIFSGTVAVAIYGVAAQINSMYLLLSLSLSSVFVPRVNNVVAETNNNKKLTDIFIQIGRIQFVVMSLFLSGFLFFGQRFIFFWAGEEYGLSYRVTLFLIAPVTIPAIQNIGIEILRAQNKHKARSLAYAIIAFSNLFVSIYCIKLWGIVGAAIGTALTFVLGNGIFMNWYYYKKIGLDIPRFWKEILNLSRFLLIPCISGIFLDYFTRNRSLIILLLSIGVYTIIFSVFAWHRGFNLYEKGQFKSFLQKNKF